MGFADKAKQALEDATEKAAQLADQHGDKVDQALDKAGDLVDRRTRGKYAGQVDKVQSAAKDGADKLAAKHRGARRTPVDPGDPATPDHPSR